VLRWPRCHSWRRTKTQHRCRLPSYASPHGEEGVHIQCRSRGNAFAILQRAGDAEEPYNQFYAAVKSSGKFEIVGTPSDAELVLEIRSAPNFQHRKVDTYQPLVTLAILDSKTHFILWTITEPVEKCDSGEDLGGRTSIMDSESGARLTSLAATCRRRQCE